MNPTLTIQEISDFQSRAANLWNIRTKDNRLVNFTPNEGQVMLERIVQEEIDRSLKTKGVSQVKLVVLKSRQVGISTHTAMRNLDALITQPMCNTLVIAHDGMTTDLLYDIYKRGYNNMPEHIDIVDENGEIIHANFPIKPSEKSYSGKKLHLDKIPGSSDILDSRLTVQTAGSGDNVGKGITLNRMHLCMGYDSPILLSDGTKIKVSESKIGDKVYTQSGAIAPITNIFYSGEKQTFTLRTWMSNEPVIVSKDHKILTDKGYKRVEDLTTNNWIAQPKFSLTNKIKSYTYELPNYKGRSWSTSKNSINKHTFKLDYDFGYVLGYYLAEGHCKPTHNRPDRFCTLNFGYDADETYINKVIEYFAQFDVKPKTKRRKNSRTKTTEFYNTYLASAIESICGRVDDKHIPEWFFDTNEEFVRGVLVGLYAGDGSKNVVSVNDKYTQYRVVLRTTHERIGRQVKRLQQAIGLGMPSMSIQENLYRYGKKSKTAYDVSNNGEEAKTILSWIADHENHPTSTKEKKTKCIDGVYYVRVKSIESNVIEPTIDIEIGHEDHNFETPIGIISNSEFANYPDATSVFNSTNQALPDMGDVYAVVESTANGVSGVGEAFYNLWKKSSKEWDDFKTGKTHNFDGYRPVFLPWYVMSEYQKPLIDGKLTGIDNIDFGSEETKREFLQTEQMLMDEYGVPIEGINWYRYCIKEKCSYSLSEARRYYPTFPKDAFLSTDNGFFDNTKLYAIQKKYEDNPPEFTTGYLDSSSGDLVFEEDRFGNLDIIEMPDPTYMNRYIVSLDPSTGVEEGDYAPMKVYDRLNQRWVARWYGREDEDKLAEIFMDLGYFYNEALLIPERNLATVINIIKPDGVIPYTGDVWTEETPSGAVNYGYQTNVQSRKLLLDCYKMWLRDNYDKLMDNIELEEHINFIRVSKHGTVRYEAASGHHDDIVIANALSIWAADNWEEELAKLTEDRSDIDNIITLNTSRRVGRTHKNLGFKKTKPLSKSKAKSFTKLGYS